MRDYAGFNSLASRLSQGLVERVRNSEKKREAASREIETGVHRK